MGLLSSLVTEPSRAIERVVFIHRYTSTACRHNLHDKCRLECKYCRSKCRCRCHKAGRSLLTL